MQEWISVTQALPEKNKHVFAKNGTGGIFEAIYLGPVIGWINLREKAAAYVTHWTSAV